MNHTENDDTLFKIALTMVPKVGPVTAKNLVSYSGSARAAFESKKETLLKIPGIGPQLANKIIKGKSFLDQAEAILKKCLDKKVQVLFYLDEQYPQRLKHIPDSPLLLYYKGADVLNHERIVAIVGTRKPTQEGKRNALRILTELKDYNIMVLSGLAYGVDIAAHKSALKLGLPTVAVLGSGMGKIYPSAHQRTALEMLENGGLLSEFDYDTGPDREHFPMRNRLIAGMSDAVIVIESADRGGSMITAEMANGYHKDVFALPGRSSDKMSAGCNALIKYHKAHLLEKGGDLVRIMGWTTEESPKHVQRQLFVELTEDERNAFSKIQQFKEVEVDALAQLTTLHMSKLAAVLLSLELKGLIAAIPGKRYTLV